MDLENLSSILENYKGSIVADIKMQEYLKELNIDSINFETESLDYGKVLIEIAKNKFKNNQYTKWQGLKPLYIQPPPIHQKKTN